MNRIEFELAILDYLDENIENIDSDNLSDIGQELRDIVDMAGSEWALDNGFEYEGG